MTSTTVLNLVLFLPLLGALALAFFPKEQHTLIKQTALWVSLGVFGLSLTFLGEFNTTNNDQYQFVTDLAWVPQFHIHYKVGMDGISLALVLLTTLLMAIAIGSSFDAITKRVKEYYIFLLILEAGILGVFVSLDLILFYVFWEVVLVPMYFLIGVWGGPRRMYATIKFVLYTLTGSLLMLVAILWIYARTSQGGQPTFDIELLTNAQTGPLINSTALGPQERIWLFLAFAVAFAIKVPMFPFHTWLPDAHVEAPTAGSVILAGVLLKMGTYGFVRFCIPMFPDVALQAAPYFMVLAVIGIIFGALVAYTQQDIKKLVAYSSVSHLGFCMLGLFAFTTQGVAGSVLQMINHGISTGALFLIVGMIYERRHTREISAFGGVWKAIPIFSVFFIITMLSSIGLPGLNGFVGEFMILLGTWVSAPIGRGFTQWAAVLGATGVILGAVYMLWMFQRVMQGPLDNPQNKKLFDLTPREIITLLPLVGLMFWLGVQPNSLIRMIDVAVNKNVVAPVQQARERAASTAAAGAPGLSPNIPGLPGGLPNGMPFSAPPPKSGGIRPPSRRRPAPGRPPAGTAAPRTAPAGGTR